jgi:hypothetical protein
MAEADDKDELALRRAPPWLAALVRLMDDALHVPGTRIGIGLDALSGFFVPFVGDAVSAFSHLALLWAAFRVRVPRIVIARMVMNAAIDILTGAVPLLGDVFDVTFKANRKNLELLERAQLTGERSGRFADYLVVAAAVFTLSLAMLVPLFVTGWLIAKVVHH